MAKVKKSRAAADREQRIALTASDWVVRVDRGLTPQEQDGFSEWLAADPLHQSWYAARRQAWEHFDVLADWRPEHSAEPNPDLLASPHPRSTLRRITAPLLVAAAACAGAFFVFERSSPAPAQTHSDTVSAHYESRVLDDGSVVELNRGSRIRVAFTAGERHVSLLAGEAHFKVAKNPQRPFIVEALGVGVRAVGTAFDVRLGATAVDVLVTEGRVNITSPRFAPAPVSAGQLTVVDLGSDRAPAVIAVSAEEIQRRLDWQPRLLDFNSTPLAEAAAEFNRHNRVKLVIADPALSSMPVVASIRSDNVDGFVRTLEISAGVHAERSATAIILTRAISSAGR